MSVDPPIVVIFAVGREGEGGEEEKEGRGDKERVGRREERRKKML